MYRPNTSISITCLDHQNQPLVRVNPDPAAQRHVYCLDCLMQAEDPKALYAIYPKIEDFLANSANTFAENKNNSQNPSDVSKGYQGIIDGQGEKLDRVIKHVKQEKENIEIFFDNIVNEVVDILQQLKSDYQEALNKQMHNLQESYEELKNSMLGRSYPKKEIKTMLLTEADLQYRLAECRTVTELEEFIKGIKQTVAANEEETLSANLVDNTVQKYLSQFNKHLDELENTKLILDEKPIIQTLKDDLKKKLDQIFGTTTTVFNISGISESAIAIARSENIINVESDIISTQDFLVLKKWIPEGMTFNPKLLYRMTRDGRNSRIFYQQCDKKDATITLIKCQYEGASQTSVIGGFLDQSFDHYLRDWTFSKKAFIFSLTDNVMCPILKYDSAFYNCPGYEIWFGPKGIIGIRDGFSSCSSIISANSSDIAYKDAHKIIPATSYKGPGNTITFAIEELEVFAVNQL